MVGRPVYTPDRKRLQENRTALAYWLELVDIIAYLPRLSFSCILHLLSSLSLMHTANLCTVAISLCFLGSNTSSSLLNDSCMAKPVTTRPSFIRLPSNRGLSISAKTHQQNTSRAKHPDWCTLPSALQVRHAQLGHCLHTCTIKRLLGNCLRHFVQ